MRKLIARIFANELLALDLRGCAEMANGIEKYGHLGYTYKILLDAGHPSPRQNCIITNIGVPQ